MKTLLLAGALVLSSFTVLQAQTPPSYDHTVVVMLENHGYQEVLGHTLPFINDFLRPGGANFSQSYGLQHPSQPNYYWLLSGSNQGIVTDNAPAYGTINAPNLYTALDAKGLTFSGYLDAYPGANNLLSDTTVAGNIGNQTGNTSQISYVPRHAPWLGFSNIPVSVSKDFTTFGSNSTAFSNLPKVSFVIPALENDMHDYASGMPVSSYTTSNMAMTHADQWLEVNIKAYAEWARENNSLLIITTDEDSTADWINDPPLTYENYGGPDTQNPNGPAGFTSPTAGPSETATAPDGSAQTGPNQITTIFYGAHIQPGTYLEGNGITHVNVLRTLEWLYDLQPSGTQSPAVTTIGNGPITDVFVIPEPSALALLGLTAFAILPLRRRRP